MNMLRLKMEVVSSAIMREVAVPEDFTLAFLHGVIQSIFGWLDYHMHEFTDVKDIHRMVKFVDTAQAFYSRNYYHDCYEAVL